MTLSLKDTVIHCTVSFTALVGMLVATPGEEEEMRAKNC